MSYSGFLKAGNATLSVDKDTIKWQRSFSCYRKRVDYWNYKMVF